MGNNKYGGWSEDSAVPCRRNSVGYRLLSLPSTSNAGRNVFPLVAVSPLLTFIVIHCQMWPLSFFRLLRPPPFKEDSTFKYFVNLRFRCCILPNGKCSPLQAWHRILPLLSGNQWNHRQVLHSQKKKGVSPLFVCAHESTKGMLRKQLKKNMLDVVWCSSFRALVVFFVFSWKNVWIHDFTVSRNLWGSNAFFLKNEGGDVPSDSNIANEKRKQ